ncbi:MAG TPA: ion transporter [Flavobacteriales bacterium]|jgi:voltage-gated potassium channel|nr:ion transporter [Flavobacteriales bacterium]
MDIAPEKSLKKRIHNVIFYTDTAAGKLFDIVLLATILLSIVIVALESVTELKKDHESLFLGLEWFFTILFTMEYLMRIYVTEKPRKYIFSFLGIIDLLSILPTYLSILIHGSHYLMIIRTVRLFRVFRILKLTRYVSGISELREALKASSAKITVFLLFIFITVVLMGTILYLIEGPENGFSSIPLSVYWAIVTITTVGYGDISPHTPVGQIIAALMMIVGYGVIAVPTGIISSEMTKQKSNLNREKCPECGQGIDGKKGRFCSNCGYKF